MTESLTVMFMPESAYGPTNQCIGLGKVLLDVLHGVGDGTRGVLHEDDAGEHPRSQPSHPATKRAAAIARTYRKRR